MNLHIVPQSDPEWASARLGKVTASRVSDVMARTKSGYAASRANLMAALIAERLTGEPQESYTNIAMQWGVDKEPDARALYELRRGVEVLPAGFVAHPTLDMCGASPDGFVGEEGLVEIKCPNTATHLDTLLSGKIPSKYEPQMFWQMACTGRAWCDFVSFDPRMPANMSLFVERLFRDDARIEEITTEVRTFLADLDDKLLKLKHLFKTPRIVELMSVG